jgi:hypothetical protein
VVSGWSFEVGFRGLDLLAPVDGDCLLARLGFWAVRVVSKRFGARVLRLAVLGQCRVAAFGVRGLLELVVLFITVSQPRQTAKPESGNPVLTQTANSRI